MELISESFAFISDRLFAVFNMLLSPSSTLSLISLTLAFLIGSSFIALRHGVRGEINFRAVLREFFPRHIWRSQSVKLDLKYLLANVCLFSLLVPYTILTEYAVSTAIGNGLTSLFGEAGGPILPIGLCAIIMTLLLYLAYEFGYWLDHSLSHRIDWLWEFHKVHHSATVLVPFTNWRVHVVDSIVFNNIMILVVGITHAVAGYALGYKMSGLEWYGSNALLVTYLYLYMHLQHTHLWIATTGTAGRIVMSPAHHQIHHSNDPKHFDRNFGAGLAVWDWVFGTLYVPQKQNENLTLGVSDDSHLKGLVSSTVVPFGYAARIIAADIRRLGHRTAVLILPSAQQRRTAEQTAEFSPPLKSE